MFTRFWLSNAFHGKTEWSRCACNKQARGHGGYSGAVPPKLCCAQKNLFLTLNKNKIISPLKYILAPQILKRGYGPGNKTSTNFEKLQSVAGQWL